MNALVTNGVPVHANSAAATEMSWQATGLLRPGILAFGGAISPTEVHAHHAVHIVAACTPLTVVDASGIRHHSTHLIVPTDAPHRIDTGAALGTAIYLDPETAAGAAADRMARTRGWAESAHALQLDPTAGGLVDQVSTVMHELHAVRACADDVDRHSAVTEALDLLPDLVCDGPVRGSDVARETGISAARLTQLFLEQVGIPLRRYILWLRLRITITRVGAGDELSVAAEAAGFEDTTQLTRTCRRTFGLPPTALSHTAHWDLG